jgi:hypothetical protein
MSKRVSSKKRTKEKSDESSSKIGEKDFGVVFYQNNLLYHCLAPFLSTTELVRFLCVNKRLYSMSTNAMVVLRKCQRKYGSRLDVTGDWITRCIKRNNLDALKFVLERTLREYLSEYQATRHEPAAIALHAYATFGFKAAFKYGNREIASYLLDEWHLKLQRLDNGIVHLFHYVGTVISIPKVMPQALWKGVRNNHCGMVRHFLETSFSGLVFPNDHGTTVSREKLPKQEEQQLALRLYFGCLSSGDETNHDYFLKLFKEFGKIRDYDSLVHDLLAYGKNPKFIPTLLKQVTYPREFSLQTMLKHSFDNSDPVMMKYVVSISPENDLLSFKPLLKEQYETVEAFMRKILCDLQCNLESKDARKRITDLQKRLSFIKFLLINEPIHLDWEKFRPDKSTYWIQQAWGYKPLTF